MWEFTKSNDMAGLIHCLSSVSSVLSVVSVFPLYRSPA
jgi:hypothetical protein